MRQRLTDLFDVSNGHDLDLLTLDKADPGDRDSIAYVSRSASNNGVLAHVKRLDDVQPASAGTLSLSVGGSVCATFLQPRPYYTAQNVRVLTPKTSMTDTEKLWWAMCIWHNRYRFSYGRHANRTYKSLVLPSSAPSWVASAVSPEYASLNDRAILRRPPTLDPSDWATFRLDSLFEVVRGKYIPVADKALGSTPEVSATVQRNGVGRYVDLPPEHSANVITVARNGAVGWATVQPRAFFATDDVHVLYPREQVSDAALLFMCALIRREQYRFNYGRKWSLSKMKGWELKLPVVAGTGKVDWQRMDKYVRRLPFSARALSADLCTHG